MPAKKLSESEIASLLPKAKGWSVVNSKLHREFACKDFVAAFGNMTRVALVADGLSNRQVASELGLSEHTVKKYLFRIFDKLGISSRVELVLYAFSHGDSRQAEWVAGGLA